MEKLWKSYEREKSLCHYQVNNNTTNAIQTCTNTVLLTSNLTGNAFADRYRTDTERVWECEQNRYRTCTEQIILCLF